MTLENNDTVKVGWYIHAAVGYAGHNKRTMLQKHSDIYYRLINTSKFYHYRSLHRTDSVSF